MVSHRKSAAAVSDKRAVVQIVEYHCFKRDITRENGRVVAFWRFHGYGSREKYLNLVDLKCNNEY